MALVDDRLYMRSCKTNIEANIAWSNSEPELNYCMQMGKHESYEEPPDKPFFRGKKSSALSAVNIPTQLVSISPGKKVNMCTELINLATSKAVPVT